MPLIEDFAQHTVKADTNFEPETLQYIWDKYNSWNGSSRGMSKKWLLLYSVGHVLTAPVLSHVA